MSLTTISANILDGRIIPEEPEKVPKSGRALVTILQDTRSEPAPSQVTVAELVGDLFGSGNGSFTDLSTNKIHLSDFGE